MKPVFALVPALLVPLLAAPSSSAAAEELCFGQTPTIVGTQFGKVTGTEGPDVILTNGANRVLGLGGDDLICVVGELRRRLDAGPGDDQVSTERAQDGVKVRLGSGADTFVGGPSSDYVNAGDQSDVAAGLPPSVDHISTGGRHDEVTSGAGRDSTAPNGDVLSLGPSDDSVRLLGRAVPSIDGGSGSNGISLSSTTGGDWVINAGTGGASIDDVEMGPLVGFRTFRLYSLDWDELEFVGGPAGEDLELAGRSGRAGDDGPIAVDMGGGGDNVWARSQDVGSVDGGRGRDWLRVEARGTTSRRTGLVADLERGYFHLSGQDRTLTTSWERTSFSEANFSLVNGTDGPDDLLVWGCHTTLRGRGGNDLLVGYECDKGPHAGNRIEGGPGNDKLTGSVYRDRLIGGPGRDYALGGGGGDLCAVETKEYCR
jgi:hypothetical protein